VTDTDTIRKHLKAAFPAGVDFCSARYMSEVDERLSVRKDIVEPVGVFRSAGVMFTVADGGGLGYGATCDLSPSGLARAVDCARRWARRTAGRSVIDFRRVAWPCSTGEWHGVERVPWESAPLADKLSLLMDLSRGLKQHDLIVDWGSVVRRVAAETLYVTGDGGCVHQTGSYMFPHIYATAHEGTLTQTRTLGAIGNCRQGGMEVLEDAGYIGETGRVAGEAVALLRADNCPTAEMDVVLDPDQMILQVHESIGHPLELDRILGDERNYAGTSFVSLDMIGSYRYGSELLNVSFDPARPEELATYGYDDEGCGAVKTMIVEKGVLQRALGGTVSQTRSGVPGVANARAHGWNRPAMDRMANLNIEPGDQSLDELIAATERGIYMKTNCSWSIDDSRNKFQFGCEWGRLIEDGELTGLVRTPGYRGISATFWRSLAGVGREETVELLGAPNCGKGEPNQLARVGHAVPPCRFQNVQVFGGE